MRFTQKWIAALLGLCFAFQLQADDRGDAYYREMRLVHGVKVYRTKHVSDWTYERVLEITRHMMDHIRSPEQRERLRKSLKGHRLIVMNYQDRPTQMPYLKHVGPRFLKEVEENYRGFSSGPTTLVTQEMVCKRGVETRGNADRTYRAFDQVIHEFAHTIEGHLSLYKQTNKVVKASGLDPFWKQNPREAFAMSVQMWFGHNYSYDASANSKRTQRFRYPQIYRYMAQIFDPTDNWSPRCK